MTQAVEVLLIGGTSHVGKSTLAEQIAKRPGWQCISTDSLARHPGRPWRPSGAEVPADVIEHFLGRTTAELVDDVTRHYRRNVWPIAEAIVRSRLNNPFDPRLVLEGSAVLPDLVVASGFERVRSVWLNAPEHVLAGRMRRYSDYDTRSDEARAPIEAFIERSLSLGRLLAESAAHHGAQMLDASTPGTTDRLLAFVDAGAR